MATQGDVTSEGIRLGVELRGFPEGSRARRLGSFCLNSANPVASSVEDLKALAEAPLSAGVTSRTSLLEGFPHEDSQHTRSVLPNCSINCYGYSPHPYTYYASAAQEILKQVPHKPFFMSITGTPAECLSIMRSVEAKYRKTSSPTAFELNLSCPNIDGHPPIAYEPRRLQEYLQQILLPSSTAGVSDSDSHRTPVGLKLPPYFYDAQFVDVAQVINHFNRLYRVSKTKAIRKIAYVVCINTVGGGLEIDTKTEQSVLLPSTTLRGGIGGPAVKPLALGNVARFRQLLDQDIDVIGCGGISTGEDAFHYFLAGASCVEVGTLLLRNESPKDCYNRIAEELRFIMKSKGYTSIAQFQGATLKPKPKL